MWTAHAGDRGGQRTPDTLDLKSKVIVNRYVGEGNKTRVLYQCSLPEPSHQPWKEIIWVVLRISQSIFNSHFCIFPAKPYHPFHFWSDSDKELCKLASTEPPGDGRVCISNFPAWRLARLSFPYIQNWKGRTAWLVLFFLIHCLFCILFYHDANNWELWRNHSD